MDLRKGDGFGSQGKAEGWKQGQEDRAFGSRCCCWFLAQPRLLAGSSAPVLVSNLETHQSILRIAQVRVRKTEGARSTLQIRLLKSTKENTLSSVPASSSVLPSLQPATPSLVASAASSGMESLGHASLSVQKLY